jgi:uncharacterized protein (TIGR03067 family)
LRVASRSLPDAELQCTWLAEGCHVGKQDSYCHVFLNFKSGTVKYKNEPDGVLEAEWEGSYRIDPTTNPKLIDLVFPKATWKGIYKVDGDWLILTVNMSNGPRPVSLAPKDDKTIAYSFYRLVTARKGSTDYLISPRNPEPKLE